MFQTEVFTSARHVRVNMLVIFSRIWRASPKFLAGCPQESPAKNFLFGLTFLFLIVDLGILPFGGELSGTGDSQRDSRESIRANHSQLKPLFL